VDAIPQLANEKLSCSIFAALSTPMSQMPAAVIIVNFDFPPNQGIGGRRWAKLAKGLASMGLQVVVVKADPVSNNNISAWTQDTKSERIEVHSIKRTYPESVSHPKKGWKHKFRYLWDLNQLKKEEQGTIYDVAIGWQEVLTQKLQELVVSKGIKHVIATGAPFNALYYCALFKQKNPEIKLLVDYRDPWLTAKNYGMPFLDSNAMNVEIEKQNIVFRFADKIISPYQELTDRLFSEAKSVTNDRSKFHVLPHFYDETDLHIPRESIIKTKEKVTFVYGGALYTGTSDILKEWKTCLQDIESNSTELSKQLYFKLFTDNQIEAKIFEGLSTIQISPTIGKGIFDELVGADFCIMMAADHNKNQFTTKFFEYLPLRKPFVYLGPEGELSKFIESNRLGRRLENISRDLPILVNDFNAGRLNFNSDFDISSYTLHHATDRLLSFLS
jgi:hypothetical protein